MPMPTKRKFEDVSLSKTGGDEDSEVSLPDPEVVRADHRFANLYEDGVNFVELAVTDSDFASYCKNGLVDFSDAEAVVSLTRGLLRRDFDLDLEIPGDRLCPMVHNRHNYILWVKGLLDTSLPTKFPQSAVVGLDIGTGASCIYPLLACRQRPWKMVGSDIDDRNIQVAKRNAKRNGLEDRISIIKREAEGSLVDLEAVGYPDGLTFCMTNPPFYESKEELEACANGKERPAPTICTGDPIEMVTVGGEVGFAERILKDSLRLRDKVRWYTTMFGKLLSVEKFVGKLWYEKIANYAIGEFRQGTKTKRWAVAWSFCLGRPTMSIARGATAASLRRFLPPVCEFLVAEFPATETARLRATVAGIRETIEQLDLEAYKWDVEGLRWRGTVAGNVWGRAYRRRKEREKKRGQPEMVVMSKGEEQVLGFEVRVEVGVERVEVSVGWKEGGDERVWESFVGLKSSKNAAMTLMMSTTKLIAMIPFSGLCSQIVCESTTVVVTVVPEEVAIVVASASESLSLKINEPVAGGATA